MRTHARAHIHAHTLQVSLGEFMEYISLLFGAQHTQIWLNWCTTKELNKFLFQRKKSILIMSQYEILTDDAK